MVAEILAEEEVAVFFIVDGFELEFLCQRAAFYRDVLSLTLLI